MKPKTFRILLYGLMSLGLLLTAAHVAYAWYAYQYASILQFIAREMW